MIEKRTNPFPGTDDKTGWPLTPAEPCPQGETAVLPNRRCYLATSAIGGPPIVCIYEPLSCPFWGHYPEREDEAGSKPAPGKIAPARAEPTKQEKLI